MAASASLTVSGTLSSLPTGSQVLGPLTITSSAANGTVQEIVLQAGANTITVPTSPAPIGCFIVLPNTNTSVVTLKGVSGDTGIAIGKTTWHWLAFDPTALPTSFVLSSVSTQTGKITYIHWI